MTARPIVFYANHSLLLCIFSIFNEISQILHQINVKIVHSVRQDSNSQPQDYESPPLITGPGLPPSLPQVRISFADLRVFIKNWPTPASFSFILGLIQTNNTIFKTNQCEKCPSSLWRQDLDHGLSNTSHHP